MYEIYGINHIGTIEFHKYYMEAKLAKYIFTTLISCEDCAHAHVLDATTGEVLAEWDFADK